MKVEGRTCSVPSLLLTGPDFWHLTFACTLNTPALLVRRMVSTLWMRVAWSGATPKSCRSRCRRTNSSRIGSRSSYRSSRQQRAAQGAPAEQGREQDGGRQATGLWPPPRDLQQPRQRRQG